MAHMSMALIKAAPGRKGVRTNIARLQGSSRIQSNFPTTAGLPGSLTSKHVKTSLPRGPAGPTLGKGPTIPTLVAMNQDALTDIIADTGPLHLLNAVKTAGL